MPAPDGNLNRCNCFECLGLGRTVHRLFGHKLRRPLSLPHLGRHHAGGECGRLLPARDTASQTTRNTSRGSSFREGTVPVESAQEEEGGIPQNINSAE